MNRGMYKSSKTFWHFLSYYFYYIGKFNFTILNPFRVSIRSGRKKSSTHPTGITLGERLTNYGLWAKSGPLSIFVNKIFLKHRHEHLLTFTCCLFVYISSPLNFSAGEEHKNYPILCHHFIAEELNIWGFTWPVQNDTFGHVWLKNKSQK